MKKHPVWAGANIAFLIAAMVFVPSLARLTQADTRGEPLRAELRGDDNRRPIFRANYRNDIHFLLFSQRDGTKIFQRWCSWGYFTRSFSARALGGSARQYALKRNPNMAWTKNFPATHTLGAGQFLISSADLCDGSWIAEPALPLEDLELEVIGHFAIPADEETAKQKVWTGELSTEPLVILLGRDCAEVLNKRK